MTQGIKPEWDTPPDGDFASYIERLSAGTPLLPTSANTPPHSQHTQLKAPAAAHAGAPAVPRPAPGISLLGFLGWLLTQFFPALKTPGNSPKAVLEQLQQQLLQAKTQQQQKQRQQRKKTNLPNCLN